MEQVTQAQVPARARTPVDMALQTLDSELLGTRGVNRALRGLDPGAAARVLNPRGRHNLAVGLTAPVRVTVEGNAGYFLGGLGGERGGTGPDIVVNGFVGWSVGENLMGGTIRVRGSASQSAGASARGGRIFVEGDASLRAGISLKGATVAIAGDAGAMTGFMAQAGTILIGGDAGHALGDSLYEAVIYVQRLHRLPGRGRRGRGHDRRRRVSRRGPGRRDGLRPRGPRPGHQGGLGPAALPLLDPPPRLLLSMTSGVPENHTFTPDAVARVHAMAETGHYAIRGLGARRKLPTFDDLVFLTASVSRYPLEGYRERCDTATTLGTRHASKPLHLDIPITIAGMSFGALSASAKEALGRAATEVGTSTTTGDGGMTPEERKASQLLVYQVLPSRYGFDPADLRQADAVEIVVGQGAKPGGGGLLLGQKVNERVAGMRTLPPGIDQRSASRHPDWVGPDDLRIKIEELREATDWAIPIYVKLGATRVDHDVKLAVAAGADVVVVDGMQGGTAATQDVFIEHAGIPTLPAVRMAAEALRDIGVDGEVQLVVSGGIRSGADVAKALALGADAVSIGVAALLALGCNRPAYRDDAGPTGA